MGLTEDLRSVTDELFSNTCDYYRITAQASRFMNNRDETTEVVASGVRCLLIPVKTDRMDFIGAGVADRTEAYIYFHRQDFEDAGLATTDDMFLTVPQRDFLIVKGQKWRILGQAWVGPDFTNTTPDQYVLVRLELRKFIDE